ncbi:MAG: GTPase Era [Clostridia bacterium]|nr:GTPase Era [Clostridia bacterium]
MTKTLFAALIGRPNVGKSTLLNHLLGEKVSIVSNKPQTTRTKITGILTKDETQYVFLDTPGVHKPQNKLGSFMVKEANNAVGDVDVVMWLVESGDKIGPVESSLIKKFSTSDVPVILLVNKTDISKAEEIGNTILRFSSEMEFEAVIPISAKNGENVDAIFEELDKFSFENDWIFPDDMITDQPERVMAAEIIREKLLLTLDKEIPHGTAVVIEEFKESNTMISIRAEIFCEKASHKPIIIGKGGAELKRVGTKAREDMERFFGVKVFLDLWVKVKENWRESEVTIANFGYKKDEFDGY